LPSDNALQLLLLPHFCCCPCFCCSFYGLLLDNTKELRKTLEDGNAVIRNIRILRNATCTPPSFKPPTATPARITGEHHSWHAHCSTILQPCLQCGMLAAQLDVS
jgi:hypothetical protein